MSEISQASVVIMISPPQDSLLAHLGRKLEGAPDMAAASHQSHHFKRLICKSECAKLDVTSVMSTLMRPWLIA